MRIGITGGTGFIGGNVVRLAQAAGNEVVIFTRNPTSPGEDGATFRNSQGSEPLDVSGCDAIVNLAGQSILCPWTPKNRQRILQSRTHLTRRLVQGIRQAATPPRVLVSASAIGFYGDTGDSPMDENAPPGSEFLSEVAQAWEHEARQVESTGCRLVIIRIGFVLGRGGAMRLLKPVFRMGLGGKLGDGQQWMSCIHVRDVAGMILSAIANPHWQGAFNAVMPAPVTNTEFTQALARASRRPAILPTPAWAIRLALGQLSHLLLDSQRVLPERTQQAGYAWQFPTLPAAFGDLF